MTLTELYVLFFTFIALCLWPFCRAVLRDLKNNPVSVDEVEA